MSDKKEETPPGGDDLKPDADPNLPGGDEDAGLEGADAATVLAELKKVRKEAAKAREKAAKAKEQADLASTKLKELEDAKKTQEEKDAEKRAALEADAAKLPGLQRYAEHVKAELATEMKRVDGLKAEQKKPYLDLLAAFGEEDFLGRLSAVRAIKAAEGIREPVKQGDEGNPADPGGGAAGKTLASQLAWSPDGLREAELAGLIPKKKD